MDIHTHRMLENKDETTPIDTNVDGEAGALNVDNEVEEIQQSTEIVDVETEIMNIMLASQILLCSSLGWLFKSWL